MITCTCCDKHTWFVGSRHIEMTLKSYSPYAASLELVAESVRVSMDRLTSVWRLWLRTLHISAANDILNCHCDVVTLPCNWRCSQHCRRRKWFVIGSSKTFFNVEARLKCYINFIAVVFLVLLTGNTVAPLLLKPLRRQRRGAD